MLLTLKMEEGAPSQGMQMAPRSEKGQGTNSLQNGMQPWLTRGL